MGVKIKGLDEHIKALEKADKNTPETMKKVVEAGMQPVTNSLRSVISSLPTDPPKYVPEGQKRKISVPEKKGLLDSMGYTPVRNNGTKYDSNAGVQGYNPVRTEQFPRGIPNKMLLDAVDSGSSFREKQPVFSRVKSSSQKDAIDAMDKAIEDFINSWF